MISKVGIINFSGQFVLPTSLCQLRNIPGMLRSRPVRKVYRVRNSRHSRDRNKCSILRSSWIISGQYCSPGFPARSFGSWAGSYYWCSLASSAHNFRRGCYCRSYCCCSRSYCCYFRSCCFGHSCCCHNRLGSGWVEGYIVIGPGLLWLVAVVLDDGVGGQVVGVVVGLPAVDVGVGVAHLELFYFGNKDIINPALFSLRQSSRKVVQEVFSFINAFSLFVGF